LALGNPASPPTAKLGAVWALAAIRNDDSLPPLREALRDANATVVIAAARSVALHGDIGSAPALQRLLASENSAVRRAAAEALARCGDANSLPALWEALAGQPDRFLEHSLVYAIHRIAAVPSLQAALQHQNPRVQKAALLLLDQPPRLRGALAPEQVIQRVTASDVDLRQTALRVLQNHPEWVKEATAVIERWLGLPRLTPEEQAGFRGLLLAFQHDASIQQLTGAAIASEQTPVALRLFLLETVAQCELKQLPTPWLEGLARAIESPPTRRRAVQTVASLQTPSLDDRLTRLADDDRESMEVRVEALGATVGRRPKLSSAAFGVLLEQLSVQTNPVGRLAACDVLRRSRLTDAQTLAALETIRGDALIRPDALLPAFQESTGAEVTAALLDHLAELMRGGWQPGRPELDSLFGRWPVEARAGAGVLRGLLKERDEAARDRLARFEPLLAGGNVTGGRAVFFGNKVACSTCHSIGELGGKVGPDLTKVGAIRSGHDILESVLLPSASFAQGYESYRVTIADGEEFSGMIVRQTSDTVVLRGAGGSDVQLWRTQIQEMRRAATSVMPEGLEQGMTPEEFRDLLAFLQSLK
jgi:putative heme-binding domain-containing protein